VRDYLHREEWEFWEVIVVDDGSKDATGDVARRAKARVLANPGNRGRATRSAWNARAKGEWCFSQMPIFRAD